MRGRATDDIGLHGAIFPRKQDRERAFHLNFERFGCRCRAHHDPADQRADERDSFKLAGLAVGQCLVNLGHLGRILLGGVRENLDHLVARLTRDCIFEGTAFRCEFIQPWPSNSRFRVTILHQLQHAIDLADDLGKFSMGTPQRLAPLLSNAHALLAIGFDGRGHDMGCEEVPAQRTQHPRFDLGHQYGS